MKYFLSLLIAGIVAAQPVVAFAHASPVEYIPASSSTVTSAPDEVVIRFSERAEPSASRISVKDEAGKEITLSSAKVDGADPHVLFVPVASTEQGAFFVSWSVVSADDGHFTKGGFTYFIGDTAQAGTASVPQVEVVQLSALPEAVTMAVELLGNSLLLAALVTFAFVIRRRLVTMDEKARHAAGRIHTLLVIFGTGCALAGAFAHVVLKTSELATLHALPLLDALPLYLGTVSGSATLIRAGAVLVFFFVFVLRASFIRAATRFTFSEGVLATCLIVFAYFRSIVSHATANPFMTEVGIATNFIHLIAKDLSAGILIALVVFMLSRSLRPYLGSLIGSGMRLVTLLFAPLVASAAYIVWLHLKDFNNFTSTLWGERSVLLIVSAVCATTLLAYHIVFNRLKPMFVQHYLRYTLPAEAISAVCIVFFSALMIITSPPLHEAPPSFSEVRNDARISLSISPNEDGMALLTFTGQKDASFGSPVVILDGDAEGGLLLDVAQRFDGGYVFPLAVLTGDSTHTLSVSASQTGGYDARALFTLQRADLALPEEGTRTFSHFTFFMLVLGLAGVLFALVLYRMSRNESWEEITPSSLLTTALAGVVTIFVVSQLMGLASFALRNDFKQECVADGNAWHLMLPTREGKPVSSTPAEGCMALNGAFHITDVREYRYLKAPVVSHVEFSTDFETISAGTPSVLAFSIRNEDGSVPRLVAQHERLVHVIIISKDMTEFFHVHPDDATPLTGEATEAATFSVPFTFPKAGDYIIGIDYASGLSARSEQFRVSIEGAPRQQDEVRVYPLRSEVAGYQLSLQPGFPAVGQPATLVWRIQKDGEDVLDLEPYLAAAMHVAIVKDDLSEFVHAHGEVHVPGAPLPKVTANGVHTHAPPPPRFGPLIEAHPVFPSAGDYTVFAQFMHDGQVVNAPFSVRVE